MREKNGQYLVIHNSQRRNYNYINQMHFKHDLKSDVTIYFVQNNETLSFICNVNTRFI